MEDELRPIPYGRQSISEDDIEAVVEVMRSDWLTQGPAIPRFEQAVAGYCDVKHAVAVTNGTAALHLACLAAGLGPGDLLWTSPNTFAATANCARYVGADVDFVDIDPVTYNMSVDLLAEKLEAAMVAGRLPKIVVPVHFAGQSCDMDAIGKLAEEYGFMVLEDAAHAIGGDYAGRKVGCCEHSAMAEFSFHPVKIVTTGEGGMVVTNDDALADRLRLLRTHGITRDPGLMEGPPEGGWYYQQVELGHNLRITDMQAALGASQMTRIDDFVEARHAVADRYDEELADLPLGLPHRAPGRRSALHLYPIRILPESGRTRLEVYDALQAARILANVHYIPVHLHPYYRRLGFEPGTFPEAERYYSQAISIPMYASLTEDEQSRVIAALREALG